MTSDLTERNGGDAGNDITK